MYPTPNELSSYSPAWPCAHFRLAGGVNALAGVLFMIISHVKIIAFQTITNHSSWTFYIRGKHVVLYNKQRNTWVLGNTRFISRVEHDISHSFATLTR